MGHAGRECVTQNHNIVIENEKLDTIFKLLTCKSVERV